jgi:hypothetical protein
MTETSASVAIHTEAHCCNCADQEDHVNQVTNLVVSATSVIENGRPGELQDAAEAFLLQEFRKFTTLKAPKF